MPADANAPALPAAPTVTERAEPQLKPRALERHAHAEIVVFAACAIALSIGAMLLHIGNKPFWVDESIAVLPAKSIHRYGLPRSPFDLNYMAPQLEDRLWDPSAPLYRYSVALVTAFTGFSEATTRGWSVFLGLLMLLPCFGIFKRLYGSTTAWIAIALLAALPAFSEHAREARHFTFVGVTMISTYYFLLRSNDRDGRHAMALWPVFFTATLLGHYIGYLMIPAVAVYLLYLVIRVRPVPEGLLLTLSPRVPLDLRYKPVYFACAALYGLIMLKYGNTLPAFTPIGCFNRAGGCEPSPLYYLGTMLVWFGADESFGEALRNITQLGSQLSMLTLFPATLMLLGLHRTIQDFRADAARRNEHFLVLSWFFAPLLLISSQELKYPRYLFYTMPVMMLFVARGLVEVSRWSAFVTRQRPALAGMAAITLLCPHMTAVHRGHGLHWKLDSRYVLHLQELARDTRTDSWEHTRQQADFLKAHMKPGDLAVSSFDDASLTYYVGFRVYGFLNSEHDDAFFLRLLSDAAKRGNAVYFLDQLPAHNYCHTPGLRPVNIDCRSKYAAFYEACQPDNPGRDPTCIHVHIE